ncbi:MAG: hypothetical protein EOP10_02615 [Proteobacteria bacterium]|nr:MAG: hypothetical protein EOP10_02615 [Pseudomonadota bacterium]
MQIRKKSDYKIQTEVVELQEIYSILQIRHRDRLIGLSWMHRSLRSYFAELTLFEERYRYPEQAPVLQRSEYMGFLNTFVDALKETALAFPQGNSVKGDVRVLLHILGLDQKLDGFINDTMASDFGPVTSALISKSRGLRLLEAELFALESEPFYKPSPQALKIRSIHRALLTRKIADESGLSKLNSHLEGYLQTLKCFHFKNRGYHSITCEEANSFLCKFFNAVEKTAESGISGQKVHVIAGFILRSLDLLGVLEEDYHKNIPACAPGTNKVKFT